MDTQKALGVLIEAVKLATKRGAFELGEIEIILDAVKSFSKVEEPKVEEKPVEKKK